MHTNTLIVYCIPTVSMASFCFLFLGVGSMSKLRRGSFPPDLLRTAREGEPWSAGDRFSICDLMPSSMGDRAGTLFPTGDEEGPFVLGAAAFLPLALITLIGSRSGWPARSRSFGTRDVPSCR